MRDTDTQVPNVTMSGGRALVAGLLVGAAVGAAIGVLFAPRSGADMRKDIARSARDARERAASVYRGARSGLHARVSTAADTAHDAVERIADRALG